MSFFLASELAAFAPGDARLLNEAGAEPGRPIVVGTASAEILARIAFAAPHLRTPLFPIDPALPQAVVADLIAQSGAGLVVGERPVEGPGFLSTDAFSDASQIAGPSPSRRWVAPSGIALLVATSGSTGHPKAVMLSGANLQAAARAGATVAPLQAGDLWLACLPLFHIGGFSILVRTALAGAEALIAEKFDATTILNALRERHVTHLSLVPAMLSRLLDADEEDAPESLRHVLIGGAALSPELAERAASRGWPIQPTYGMSETASQLATLPALPRPWRAGFVGQPLGETEVALDPSGKLKVRGPNVMAGYANPTLAPGDGLSGGWFLTADLAEIDETGAITILGRADDVIVSGGKKIMPQSVEALLAKAPGVAAVAVTGRADPVWGEIVTAVYAGRIDEAALLAWCRDHIEGALRPRAVVQVAALPLLASGKPDRSALKQIAAGQVIERGKA
ncbi:O-succinylbenzoic acid--CoA ligase [Rhodopseudomonas julia]|uniref:O-succinylbenzoic acid--CoA ligase n=1 Tax=Rhodopseudomonas julia TaxID=200617 RepID=A0ABU0C2G5_9BRAD|nr:AMP-binding protein [Rhodopseudomonas julia]MDQ0324383.1 O-succinylbenzoic acid--CoA ligase [Rhodopseudomonas julia]